MKIKVPVNGLFTTGTNDLAGNLLIGTNPQNALNGIVSSVADNAITSLTSQATNMLNNTVSDIITDALDDISLGGYITDNIEQIKYSISDSITSTITSSVNNLINDDIDNLTGNLDNIKGGLSTSVDDIRQNISNILSQNSSNIPDLPLVNQKIDNILNNIVTSEINGVVDGLASNFGRSLEDTISSGLDSVLGKDISSQLGLGAAGNIMDAMQGFKIVLGSSLNRTIVGQGSVLVGGGSKLISLSQGALSLGAGASLIKLAAGMISIGSGSSKVSIGDGDVKVGGASVAFKSPKITINLNKEMSGTGETTLENLADGVLNLPALKVSTPTNKGSITTSVIFDVLESDVQTYTSTGSHTWVFTNWPIGYRQIRIIATNPGLGSITFPTIRWFKGDGTSSTSFSSTGVTLQSSGVNIFDIWSIDGETIYGRAF